MPLFKRKDNTLPIPKGCEGLEVKVESSTCTGEKTIGFYDRVSGRLLNRELVRSQADIDAFYRRYGLSAKD
ncbi:MAG: hypothetical protein IJ740_11730 [Ruminococcus sp.]|nr:hypothetical protein [Ruminococcus sp.]